MPPTALRRCDARHSGHPRGLPVARRTIAAGAGYASARVGGRIDDGGGASARRSRGLMLTYVPDVTMDDRKFHLEETASALTHGVGALASVAGGAVLITFAALGGDGWQLLSAI